MNRWMRRGVASVGRVARRVANGGTGLAGRLEQAARSVITGIVVIGSRRLLGNPAGFLPGTEEGGPPGTPESLEPPAGAVRPGWPAKDFDQIKAVHDLLLASRGTLSELDVAGIFPEPSVATIRRHLRTLEGMGLAFATRDARGRSGARWTALVARPQPPA
jgi:hypothetical protein